MKTKAEKRDCVLSDVHIYTLLNTTLWNCEHRNKMLAEYMK